MSESRVELKTIETTIAGCLYSAVVFYETIDSNIKIWIEFLHPKWVARKFLVSVKPCNNNNDPDLEVLTDQILTLIQEYILRDIQGSLERRLDQSKNDMFNKLKGVLQ